MDMNQVLSITPLLFAIISAVWFYWLFISRREAEPGAELQINVDFVGQQKAKWLIEVSAILTNRSLVRHRYLDFRVNIRYLLPADEIVDGKIEVVDDKIKDLHYQTNFPHTIDERIPKGEKRYFANAEYIDPKLSFRHSYITFVPAEATFILVQCNLQFPTRRRWLRWKKDYERKNAQRLFKVPKEAVNTITSEGYGAT
jgi:hypothetical protein